MSATRRKHGGRAATPRMEVSGLPLAVREPVALVQELHRLANDEGLSVLAKRLQTQRAEPRFDGYLWSPTEMAYSYFRVPGGDVRTAGARQRRDDLETWVAVPEALKEYTGRPAEVSKAGIGLLGYLVVHRHRSRAFCTTAIMWCKKGDSLKRRQREFKARWSAPFVAGLDLPGPWADGHRAGRGPAEPARPVQLRAVWLEAGGRAMGKAELSLILAQYLQDAGALTAPEIGMVRRARERWVVATASAVEAANPRVSLSEARLKNLLRDIERYLKRFECPQPRSLFRTVQTAVRRAGFVRSDQPFDEEDDEAVQRALGYPTRRPSSM